MNILFISPNSPLISVGGVERFLTNLITFSQDLKGVRTTIVFPSFDENKVEERGNVTIYHDTSLALSRDSSASEISVKAQEFYKRIEKLILQRNIHIICAENFHIGLPPAYSLLLNMLSGLHKTPLVLQLHSFATTELQVQIINQLMWQKISSVSKSVTGDCFLKGANIDILSTDYLGVDKNQFNNDIQKDKLKKELGLTSKNKLIFTASRIILGRKNILKEKGIINTIQAFSKLSPRYPDLRLLIGIGKSPESLKKEFDQSLEMLKGYLLLNNISGKTILKSFKLDEMPYVYAGSDLFVLPSENETFGQVFIEAMACGLPVIGTNVGGIPEIITQGVNGYLIQPDDSSVLAQRIEELLNNDVLRNKFIEAGFKTVDDKFTFDKQFTNFLDQLKLILSPKNQGLAKSDSQLQ